MPGRPVPVTGNLFHVSADGERVVCVFVDGRVGYGWTTEDAKKDALAKPLPESKTS
jgi:hypothetical protein